jgi:hypothetical protein
MKKTMRKTQLATALGAALVAMMSVHGPAHAQSAADLKKDLEALKAQLQALQKKVEEQEAKQQQGQVDPAEFNRIKIKTESVEDNFEAAGLKQLKISGMLDPTFIYSQRPNTSSFVFLNNFDGGGRSGPGDSYSFDNSYFGQAMLDIQKETEGNTKWRLTLAPHKAASSGFNGGSIVHEASVSVPLSELQTRLIAGQVPDWSGYEYIFSHQQPLITHNLLFDFTIPSFYSGMGMEFFSGKWWSRFMLGNINQARKGSGQKAPGLTYRVDWSRGEFNGFGFSGQHSREKTNKYDLFEVDGYFIRGDWTLQGQLGVGQLKNSAANGSTAKWSAISALAGYKFTPRLQGIARADYIKNQKNGGGVFGQLASSCSVLERDVDGTITGTVGALTGATDAVTGEAIRVAVPCADGRNGFGPGMQLAADSLEWEPIDPNRGVNRTALSLGLNYLLNQSTSLKFEVRSDRASAPAFIDVKDNSYKKSNLLFGSSVVVQF